MVSANKQIALVYNLTAFVYASVCGSQKLSAAKTKQIWISQMPCARSQMSVAIMHKTVRIWDNMDLGQTGA